MFRISRFFFENLIDNIDEYIKNGYIKVYLDNYEFKKCGLTYLGMDLLFYLIMLFPLLFLDLIQFIITAPIYLLGSLCILLRKKLK